MGAILTGIPGEQLVAVAIDVADEILSTEIAQYSTDQYLSYKKGVWYHEDGHFVMPNVTVDKNAFIWYAGINYEDFITLSTVYYYHEYY